MNRLSTQQAADLDLDALTQSIVDTATALTAAAYGCFFERVLPAGAGRADSWTLSRLAGVADGDFTNLAMPRPGVLFETEILSEAAIRSADITLDPRFASMAPLREGQFPVRSFLAVVVASRRSDVVGALLFGHPEPGRFGERETHSATGFAAQVAMTIDNARLLKTLEAENAERRTIEHELRRSDERFRAAIAAVQGVLWTNSAEGRMTGEQPGWGALTGQSFEQYQGFGWAEAVHPDDSAATIEAWNEAVAERKTFVFEHRVRCDDGRHRNFAIRAVPILDEAGAIREWVGVHTDITEQREAEARLEASREAAEAANRAKSQFIANMSHELRTPLSAVIGYSGMVAEEIEDLGHAGLVEDVRKIEVNARHLLGLIDDVLDLSKIEAGRMTVSSGIFGVGEMMSDVVAAAAPLAAKKNNRLILDVPSSLGTMLSDETKVRQCLLNLIGNAAKFTDRGTITLKAARFSDGGEDWLSFTVEDTGIGMTSEQLGRLFQRFVQADESTTRQFGGTGLGLSITRAFCRKLGGDVTVDSRFGQGSIFTISLPAVLGDPPSDERGGSTGEAPP